MYILCSNFIKSLILCYRHGTYYVYEIFLVHAHGVWFFCVEWIFPYQLFLMFLLYTINLPTKRVFTTTTIQKTILKTKFHFFNCTLTYNNDIIFWTGCCTSRVPMNNRSSMALNFALRNVRHINYGITKHNYKTHSWNKVFIPRWSSGVRSPL